MSRTQRLIVAAGALALTCASAAPLCQQQDNAGLGSIKRGFDASSRTPGQDVVLTGVTFMGGITYVAGGGNNPVVYGFDGTGTLVTTFSPPDTLASMTNDGASLIGASQNGVHVFDLAGNPVNVVIANNGAQPITNPIPTSAVRAVAFDPAGNGGNGSLFTGDVGSTTPILEFDLAANVLNSYSNDRWECSGLALDPRTGNLWCLRKDNRDFIIELDRSNALSRTGAQFRQGNPDIGLSGDIDVIPGGDPSSSSPYPSDLDMVVLTRLVGPDWLFYHRVHLHPGMLGTQEAFLEARLNQNPYQTRNLGRIAPNDTLMWRINPGNAPQLAGAPAAVLFNLGNQAAIDAETRLPFLPGNPVFAELRALSPVSTPGSPLVVVGPTTIGAPAQSLTLPAGAMTCFSLIRMQGIHVDTRAPAQFPLKATNEVWTHVEDERTCAIVVEAVGPNSINNDATSGFWRVIHKGGPGIADVTFDWFSSQSRLQGDMRFNTDSAAVGDRFDAGNSTAAGCSGTYRNGSDAAVGLVYDASNNPPAACAPTANTGWIGTVAGSNAGDWRVLKFRFTNFQGGTPQNPVVFEFDCATDGGQGLTGRAMAGCVIHMTLTDGTQLASELFGDPNNPMRSVAGF